MDLSQGINWFENVDRKRPGPAVVTSRRSAKNMIQKKKMIFVKRTLGNNSAGEQTLI